MVMTVLFYDVDKRLRTTGVPTNTWSIGKPIYDLEYADDMLLLSVTPPQMEEFLKSVQVEASLYGMEINMAKTELLADNGSTPPVYFVDGTPVPSSDRVNYLSSHLTWSNPTQRAIDARKALAHTRYMKLQLVWRSRLSRATKVKIYQASIVPALTYGLDTLSLKVRHLKTIDAWYFQSQEKRRCKRLFLYPGFKQSGVDPSGKAHCTFSETRPFPTYTSTCEHTNKLYLRPPIPCSIFPRLQRSSQVYQRNQKRTSPAILA